MSFDAEFLRWMLSDGGGAAVIEPEAGRGRLFLKVERIELRSYASRFAPCMYVAPVNSKHLPIPLPMSRAGYRLPLHGLAGESLHATLLTLKRRAAAAPT